MPGSMRRKAKPVKRKQTGGRAMSNQDRRMKMKRSKSRRR